MSPPVDVVTEEEKQEAEDVKACLVDACKAGLVAVKDNLVESFQDTFSIRTTVVLYGGFKAGLAGYDASQGRAVPGGRLARNLDGRRLAYGLGGVASAYALIYYGKAALRKDAEKFINSAATAFKECIEKRRAERDQPESADGTSQDQGGTAQMSDSGTLGGTP